MSSIENDPRVYVGYEYKELIVDSDKASFYIDCYKNFGWEQDNNFSYDNIKGYLQYQNKVVLNLKRNRKIMNKMELTRLQRNFETCIREIGELEKTENSCATAYALITGVLGMVCLGLAVLALTAQTPHIIFGILCAIPGMIGLGLPVSIYRRMLEEQAEKKDILIEEKYNEIDKICEKGNKLLY